MQAQPTEPADSGICVAHGYGLKIYVHRGHLIVHDGIGRQRHTRRYHRATSQAPTRRGHRPHRLHHTRSASMGA